MYRYFWLYFKNNFFNANFNYLIIKQLRWKKCFFLSYVVMLKLSKSLFFIFLIAKKNCWLIFKLGNSIPIYDGNLKNGKNVITKILIFLFQPQIMSKKYPKLRFRCKIFRWKRSRCQKWIEKSAILCKRTSSIYLNFWAKILMQLIFKILYPM